VQRVLSGRIWFSGLVRFFVWATFCLQCEGAVLVGKNYGNPDDLPLTRLLASVETAKNAVE